MADVKLPLVEATATVADAIIKMRAAGVSGVIARSDEGAWLFQADTLILQAHHRPHATMSELIGGHWLHRNHEEHRRSGAGSHHGFLLGFRDGDGIVGGLSDDLARDLALAVRWYLCDKDPTNHQYSPAQYRALPIVNGIRYCSTKDGGVVS
jgi:CBS domain-containing protein